MMMPVEVERMRGRARGDQSKRKKRVQILLYSRGGDNPSLRLIPPPSPPRKREGERRMGIQFRFKQKKGDLMDGLGPLGDFLGHYVTLLTT